MFPVNLLVLPLVGDSGMVGPVRPLMVARNGLRSKGWNVSSLAWNTSPTGRNVSSILWN